MAQRRNNPGELQRDRAKQRALKLQMKVDLHQCGVTHMRENSPKFTSKTQLYLSSLAVCPPPGFPSFCPAPCPRCVGVLGGRWRMLRPGMPGSAEGCMCRCQRHQPMLVPPGSRGNPASSGRRHQPRTRIQSCEPSRQGVGQGPTQQWGTKPLLPHAG